MFVGRLGDEQRLLSFLTVEAPPVRARQRLGGRGLRRGLWLALCPAALRRVGRGDERDLFDFERGVDAAQAARRGREVAQEVRAREQVFGERVGERGVEKESG